MLFRKTKSGFGLPQRFTRALGWIHRHQNGNSGVAISSSDPRPYPEVSGYFIPTLRQWGERDIACQLGRWLQSIQNNDGSWSDPQGLAPYTFDTGQILKGLLALEDLLPGVEENILRGCNWLLSQIQTNGRVVTPHVGHWRLPGGRVVPEAIHLYALEPLLIAGKRWQQDQYLEAVPRAINYYLSRPGLTDFQTLSHFHAYVVEALLDLGQKAAAEDGMEQIARLQRRNGSVPAYPGCRWVCSTGLLQYAVIWYRMGEIERADRAFAYACRLQNASGGFFGSYGWHATYFPKAEISWANKYFLDALRWKIRSGFEQDSDSFPEKISAEDGRYQLVARVIHEKQPASVLDAGCGKGRILRRLKDAFPDLNLAGLDISRRMLANLPETVTGFEGSLLDIPTGTGAFDLVFCVEALEHVVHIEGALRELNRVLTPGGTLVIIDKDRTRLGRLKISEWEQWFDVDELAVLLRKADMTTQVLKNLPYDGKDGRDGLFFAVIASKVART